jgi:hypothetical protein
MTYQFSLNMYIYLYIYDWGETVELLLLSHQFRVPTQPPIIQPQSASTGAYRTPGGRECAETGGWGGWFEVSSPKRLAE